MVTMRTPMRTMIILIMMMIMVSGVFISSMSVLSHRCADDCNTLFNKDYDEDDNDGDHDDDYFGQC